MPNLLFSTRLSSNQFYCALNVKSDIGLLEAGKSADPFEDAQMLFKICEFCDRILSGFGFKPQACKAWTDYKTIETDKGIASIFIQIAEADLINTFSVEFNYQGQKIRFDQIKTSQFTNAIQITVGNGETQIIEGYPTLKALQEKIVEDMHKHPSSYIVSEEAVFGGKTSHVTKITYKNGDAYFFKSYQNYNTGYANLYSGIPLNHARFAARSVFCYEMSQMLKFDVIPETRLAKNQAGVEGYIQKMAPGKSAHDCLIELTYQDELASLKSNGEIVRQITELQLLDALMGQGDRHSNNYFIDIPTNKVTGIDNDNALGALNTHPHYMVQVMRSDGFDPERLTEHEKKTLAHIQSQLSDDSKKKLAELGEKKQNNKLIKLAKRMAVSGRAVFLPAVMDKNMIARFKNLSKEDFSAHMLRYEFSEAEITAACSRLDAIQFHITVLEQRQAKGFHSIIETDEWSSPETQARVFLEKANAAKHMITCTNYLHRDTGMAMETIYQNLAHNRYV